MMKSILLKVLGEKGCRASGRTGTGHWRRECSRSRRTTCMHMHRLRVRATSSDRLLRASERQAHIDTAATSLVTSILSANRTAHVRRPNILTCATARSYHRRPWKLNHRCDRFCYFEHAHGQVTRTVFLRGSREVVGREE